VKLEKSLSLEISDGENLLYFEAWTLRCIGIVKTMTIFMEIYTPVHMDCMCYVSGCNLHGGYNMMLSIVYLGRTLKLMQNGLRTTGIGYNTVKMRFMCM